MIGQGAPRLLKPATEDEALGSQRGDFFAKRLEAKELRIAKPDAPDPAPIPAERFAGVDDVRRLLASMRSDLTTVEAAYKPDAGQPTARELEALRNVLERIATTARTTAARVRVGARRAHVDETGGR